MTPKARMPGTKTVVFLTCVPGRYEPTLAAPISSRIISGKAKVNRAYSGLRQKLRCSSTACRAARRRDRVTGDLRRLVWSRSNRIRDGPGELQVRVFQAGRRDGQAVQVPQMVLQRPVEQPAQRHCGVVGVADRLGPADSQVDPRGRNDLAAAQGRRGG